MNWGELIYVVVVLGVIGAILAGHWIDTMALIMVIIAVELHRINRKLGGKNGS